MSRAGVAAAEEGVQQHLAGNEKSSGTGGLTVSGTVIPAETLVCASHGKQGQCHCIWAKATVNGQRPSLPFSPRERETPEGSNKADEQMA